MTTCGQVTDGERFDGQLLRQGVGFILESRQTGREPPSGHFPGGAFRHAFTLIELMVAIMLGALMMMIAIPALRASQKPPLVRATNDLLEACREARARAVLTGHPMQVVIAVTDQTTELRVEPAPLREFSLPEADGTPAAQPENATASTKPMFHAELPEDVAFRSLLINGRNAMEGANDAAAIRFNSNGTCDSLRAELQWRRLEMRRITSELITGQITVEAVL